MTGHAPPSITRRLILTLTMSMALLWVLAAAFASGILQHELSESRDRALMQTANRLLPLSVDSVQDRDAVDGVHEIHHLEHDGDHALVFQLRNANGGLVLKSDDAPTTPLDGQVRPGFANVNGFRVFTEVDPQTQLAIQVAEPLPSRDRSILYSTLWLFLPLLLLAPLSAVGIWIAVRRGLRPLLALQAEISARDSANLAPLNVSALPRELSPIASALSRLIERLSAALDSERQFAANSAHELRTPIAAALAQTQRLIETTRDEQTQAEGRKIEASLRRLVDLAEKLMQLARADAGIAASSEPVAVVPVLKLVIEESRGRARPGRVVDLKVAPGAEAWTANVNVDALGIVLRNLIDNAMAHSPPGTPVEVQVTGDKTIAVRNASPIITPEVLARLINRFERGATRAAGSGLGLAIVETILGQVGGELTLRSPAANSTSGFEAVVRLP